MTKALKKGSEEVGPPKSESGSRKIPIPDVFLSELRSIYPGDPFAYLITQPTTGKMHTRSSIRSYWNNFLRALDIQMGATVYRNQIIIHAVADDLVPYCLRHTYGTDLQDAGVPINVAKYLMGHSDISVTANIYTSTTDDAIESARQQIDNRGFYVSFYVSQKTKGQKSLIYKRFSTVKYTASQAGYEGSIPFACSNKKVLYFSVLMRDTAFFLHIVFNWLFSAVPVLHVFVLFRQ